MKNYSNMIIATKTGFIRATSGEINGIKNYNETLNTVIISDGSKTYESYGLYHAVSDELKQLALIYILKDGELIPRVTKRSPNDHMDNHYYFLSLLCNSMQIEDLLEAEKLPFKRFNNHKDDEDIFTDKIISAN